MICLLDTHAHMEMNALRIEVGTPTDRDTHWKPQCLESLIKLQRKHHSHSMNDRLPVFHFLCSKTFSRGKFGARWNSPLHCLKYETRPGTTF